MNSTLSVFFAIALTTVLFLIWHRLAVRKQTEQSKNDQQRINELELQVHAVERQFGQERNAIESAHHVALGEERQKLADLHRQHAQALADERKEVTASVREQARRDFETQSSLFSVAVRPYVRVISDNGYFTNRYESQTGYQYQLLINGIPAFQPHIVIESIENTATFNDENLKELILLATKAAEAAVALYAGKAGRSVNITQAIVERVSKK